ncbi:hypothetical protein BD408DRAFT_437354 [Parasitella parasitica]|nr:hypothetical protein BD408DRAFT_437354 [Parasitella parasitica]
MEVDNYEIEPQLMEDLLEDITVDMSNVKLKNKLFAPEAAAECGIPRLSAYRMLDEFISGGGHLRSGTTVKSKTTKPKNF